MKPEELIGKKIGHLLVEREADPYISPKGQRQRQFMCVCDCGKVFTVRYCHLYRGIQKSCGCSNNIHKVHGMANKDPLYSTWKGMRERCSNGNQIRCRRYVERGISVCDEWNDFAVFRKWMIDAGWKPGLTIDRIDNDGGYSPSNCRVVTNTVNCRNKSNNVNVTINGVTRCIEEWSEIYGICRGSPKYYSRNLGISLSDAIVYASTHHRKNRSR